MDRFPEDIEFHVTRNRWRTRVDVESRLRDIDQVFEAVQAEGRLRN